MNRLDLLLVNAPAKIGVYGMLSELAAVEPPVWAGLIATYCKARGFSVEILDAEAMSLPGETTPLNVEQTAWQIALMEPRLAVFTIYGHQPSASTQCLPTASAVARELKKLRPDIPTLALGTHPSALPERTLREEPFDYVCQGEGPLTIEALLIAMKFGADPHLLPSHLTPPGLWTRKKKEVAHAGTASNITDLDGELPGQAWDLLDMKRYKAHNWHLWTSEHEIGSWLRPSDGRREILHSRPLGGYASVQTSLGCPFKCLRGDTLINTTEGQVDIATLARTKKTVRVYTYKDGQVLIADAFNIRKLGVNQKLVRVAFDDGTHIDCTPDHQFLTFTINKPENGDVVETPVEAQNLISGLRIRAMRNDVSVHGRRVISCRRESMFNARMVMEYVIKRKLLAKERVHHKDHDTLNDSPDNLLLCSSDKEHVGHHPEISVRMKQKNPMYSQEIARKVSRTQIKNIKAGKYVPFLSTAKGRKIISVIARKRALTDNPMKKSTVAMHPKLRKFRSDRMKALWADRSTAMKRLGREHNHRVVSVTKLVTTDDVYCLEVPDTGWFFANDVLVKNCSFCCINAPFTAGGALAGIRYWSAANVVGQIARLVDDFGITNLKVPDEMFCLNRPHVKAICAGLIKLRLGDRLNMWAYARVDTVKDEEMLALMRRAGFRWLGIGVESGSSHVRDGVEKGRFGNEDIKAAIARVQNAGICVGANYIFGLPDDTRESCAETLALACELNTEWANFYCAMAYPGSALYRQAKEKGWRLPDDPGGPGWIGYSQHAYESLPLRTESLAAEEVIDIRDEAFMTYFTRPEYLWMLRTTIGQHAVDQVHKMTSLGKPRRRHRERA